MKTSIPRALAWALAIALLAGLPSARAALPRGPVGRYFTRIMGIKPAWVRQFKKHPAALRARLNKKNKRFCQKVLPNIGAKEREQAFADAYAALAYWIRGVCLGEKIHDLGPLRRLSKPPTWATTVAMAALQLYLQTGATKYGVRALAIPAPYFYNAVFMHFRDPAFRKITALLLGRATAEAAEGKGVKNARYLYFLKACASDLAKIMVFQGLPDADIRSFIRFYARHFRMLPLAGNYSQDAMQRRASGFFNALRRRPKLQRWLLSRWLRQGHFGFIQDSATAVRKDDPKILAYLISHAQLYRGAPFLFDQMIQEIKYEYKARSAPLGNPPPAGVEAGGAADLSFRFTTGHAVSAQGDRFAKEMFPFKNTTGQMVHISKITTSCSCTAARASSKLIKPGGRGEIVATVRLKGLPPHFVRYITVYEMIGSGPLPVHQKLKLLVTITPR